MFNMMSQNSGSDGALEQKFAALMDQIIAERKPEIAAFIQSDIGAAALKDAQNDEAITKLAGFVYPMLPGMVRMMLGEDKFASLLLSNRTLVIEKVEPLLQAA